MKIKIVEQLEEIIFQINTLNENLIKMYMMNSIECPGSYQCDSIHCRYCEFKNRCINENKT